MTKKNQKIQPNNRKVCEKIRTNTKGYEKKTKTQGKGTRKAPPRVQQGGGLVVKGEPCGTEVLETFAAKSDGFTREKYTFRKGGFVKAPEQVTKVTCEVAEACFSNRNMNMKMYMLLNKWTLQSKVHAVTQHA